MHMLSGQSDGWDFSTEAHSSQVCQVVSEDEPSHEVGRTLHCCCERPGKSSEWVNVERDGRSQEWTHVSALHTLVASCRPCVPEIMALKPTS